MQRALLVSRLATLGLALVLLAIGGFAIWSGSLTQAVERKTQCAVLSSNLLLQARFAITLESAQEHAYAEEIDARRLVRFDQAVGQTRSALDAVIRTGEGNTRTVARALLTLNDRYVAHFRQLTTATQMGDLAHSAVIEATNLDPLVSMMETTVGRAALVEQGIASTSLRALAHTDAFARTSTIIVFTIGLALLTLFAVVLRTYRQRIVQAELAYLAQAALSDHLTGLGNHRAFQEALEREMAHVRRHGGDLSLALTLLIHEGANKNEASPHGVG